MKPPLELLRHELRALIRPDDVWDAGMAKYLLQSCQKVWDGGVRPHVHEVKPVRVAIDYNEEVTTGVRTKIDSNFLKGVFWLWLEDYRFRWLRGQMVLAHFTREDGIVNIVVHARPIDN